MLKLILMEQRKKVIYFSPNGYLGGAERFIINACCAHKNYQASIIFLTAGSASELAQKLGIKHFIYGHLFKLSRPDTWPRFWWWLRQNFKQINPDIVHLSMPYSVLACFVPLVFFKIKRVWFQHGPIGGGLDSVAKWLPVHSVLFNSKYTQTIHHRLPGPSPLQMEQIIPLGVKVTERPVKDFNYRPAIIMAGRICQWKGIHLFVQAVKSLPSKLLEMADFNIYGAANSQKDQEYLTQLKQMATGTPIQFKGHSNNLEESIYQADLLIHASITPEPFGLIIAEAMAQGTLVIGAGIGGAADIINDGVTAIHFDSTSETAANDLSQKISTFLKDLENHQSEKYFKIKTNAKTFIGEHYSIEKMGQSLEHHYDLLLKDS